MSRLALITGASSGIGEELARHMAAEKHDLILVARSKSKLLNLSQELQKSHQVRCYAINIDLGQHGSALELYNRVKSLNLNPEILINNAGIGEVGPFALNDARKVEEILTLNIETLTLLTRYFLTDFLKQKSGRIMNVASTAAFLPGPYMAAYYGSKAYVLHFSEALAVETRGTGVTVTALCPGPVPSGFQERANMKNSLMQMPGLMSPQQVAEAGYRALAKGKTILIPGALNRLVAFLIRFSPRCLVPMIAAQLNKNRS